MTEEVQRERRTHAQRAVEPADVPIRLRRAGGHDGSTGPRARSGLICTSAPSATAPRRRRRAAERFRSIVRDQRRADDVVFRAARARELRVLLPPHDREVQRDQRRDGRRKQIDVRDEQARQELLGRVDAAEQEEREPRPDHRTESSDRVRDAQPGSAEQVVGQRIAREAGDRRDKEQQPDDPVDLARLAERAGKKDPAHVHDDAGDEHERRPVMDLPHDQAAVHLEAERERRRERGRQRPRRAAHTDRVASSPRSGRRTAPRTFPSRRARRTRTVDLAEHERPMIGKRLAQRVTHEGAVPSRSSTQSASPTFDHARSQKPGPTGSRKSPAARELPRADLDRQARQRVIRRPRDDRAVARRHRTPIGDTGRAVAWPPRDRARRGSRRACTRASTRRSRARARAAGKRTSATCDCASPSASSGKTVTVESTFEVVDADETPSSRTSASPRRQRVSNSCAPAPGQATATARASATAKSGERGREPARAARRARHRRERRRRVSTLSPARSAALDG